MFQLGLLSLLVLKTTAVYGAGTYIVKNNCPVASTLYMNGNSQGTLAANGGTFQTNFNSVEAKFDGFWYLDVNGGSSNGSTSTRVGFYGSEGYYYIVADPNHFTAGVSITPTSQFGPGFCETDECKDATCTTAYQQPPTSFPPFSNSTPPAKPLYSCPIQQTGFNITFCPDGTLPPPPLGSGQAIHPNGDNSECLDVRGAVFANGTPVQIYDCNGTNAQKWIINRANTKVQVAGTNYCLDAGSNPASGVPMKIWQCYDNLPAQAWYYTGDNRIAVTGKGQCLDLTNGVKTNSNVMQTWACTANNVNQIWTL